MSFAQWRWGADVVLGYLFYVCSSIPFFQGNFYPPVGVKINVAFAYACLLA